MISLPKFIFLFLVFLLIKPIFSQQSYDKSECISEPQVAGSNYLCSSKNFPCETFIAYRAQNNFQTLSSISSLFNTAPSVLHAFNNVTKSESSNLTLAREIIVPIICACPDRFSKATIVYNVSRSTSFNAVACGVFEGLVKLQTLVEENPYFEVENQDSFVIEVPIRCGCPNDNESSNGVNFLVTYPVLENDSTSLIALKFGVPEEMIWAANKLDPHATIFPQTTLLVPTKDIPVVYWDVASHEHGHGAVIPVKKIVHGTKSINSYTSIFLGVGVLAAVVSIIVACGFFITFRRQNHPRSFQPLSPRSSRLSNFSANFIDGMSKLKHSLINFSLEELRIATDDFSEASVVGRGMYRGRIGGSDMVIEQMNSGEAARHVITILTTINHLNIVKLEGCCYGARPYLVFEFAENGSLRDCLSNAKMGRKLSWKIRMQIAFDLAVGLHYIHFCTKPAYVHCDLNSRNVLINKDWRAKISGFTSARPLLFSEEKKETNWNESSVGGRKGYLAPEYLAYGIASTKVDVYAFGVVLVELLSAKEAINEGKMLKDAIWFLAEGMVEGSSGCLEKLRVFMDPALEREYQLGDVMCLALLAKNCVEEDPSHRPTMDDILKALSRIL